MSEADVRKKIMIATCLYQVDPVVYVSHMNMIYRVGRDLNYDIIFSAPWRVPIDKARDLAVQNALRSNCSYLFFYDDDMFLDPHIVGRLLKRIEENENVHIVQAKAYIRGYPYDPMIFKYIDEEETKLELYVDFEKDVGEDGLLKVGAVGCCCTLIDCELFKLVPEPWFVTGTTHTEDVYFCTKAKTYVENLGVYMDANVEAGHLLDRPLLTMASRNILQELGEKYNLNQLWIPDANFIQGIQQLKNPLAKKECLNPIEEFNRIEED